MSQTDHHGYPVTATHPTTVERYDAAVESLLLYSIDVADAWDATVVDDPAFTLGQIGRAYLRCLSSEGPDASDARAILGALGDGAGLTDRERRHLGAARAYAAGDLASAAEQLSALSVQYPRDALALSIGHQLDFFRGDSMTLRDRTGRALLAWDRADPWFGPLLGMHSFGLEECGLYPKAEAAGMRALEIQPRDVWASHAVVHTYEMQGRFRTGLRFVDERRSAWTEDNVFMVHNAWHEALFFMEEADNDAALRIYDGILHHAESPKVALEMLDAAALLWRIHLDRGDVAGRWGPLAEAWAEKAGEPWYAFNDMHAVMSFVGAGRLDDARAVVQRLTTYVAGGDRPGVSNVAMTAEVGLPVCAAIVAFGEERYDDVVSLLHPIRTIVQRFGGSNAQRDAVARTLLEAAIRGSNAALAQSLVSERLAVKETPYNWLQLARLRRVGADVAGASTAEAHAAHLRAVAA